MTAIAKPTVGIIGLGMMGRGIVKVCLRAGCTVLATDIDRQKREDFSSEDQSPSLTLTDSPKDFRPCDVIIETVTEDEAIKTKAIKSLPKRLKPGVIIGSNTSSLSITKLAAHRPHDSDRFLGLHFMNPPTQVPLVEVVKGLATAQSACDKASEFLKILGKKIVFAEDYPGFIVNRILMPMINEAIWALYEGIGSVEAIDQALKYGGRHPMGPLQLADLIGLDLCAATLDRLCQNMHNDKYRPCPLLSKYVEAGWLGLKTKRGFYDYHDDKPIPTR